ncbi:MAG: polysaccharide biosynthesis tyrosine autokinase [Sedimentisphaerales bacterium]|jgi:capsular exopolysaccharide synthesis family protein
MMDELTRYEGGALGPVIQGMPPVPELAGPNVFDMLTTVLLRRWRAAVIVFAVICCTGLSVIWLIIKPAYEVTGAIKVAPILSNVLTGKADSGDTSNYQSFMNTQAEMIISGPIIDRAADDLATKNLPFFNTKTSTLIKKLQNEFRGSSIRSDCAAKLKEAINDGLITVTNTGNTELIRITMAIDRPEDARQIVDAFIRAYMGMEGIKSTQDEDQKLSVLEAEKRTLADKLETQREAIRKLAEEYGTVTLDARQNMMLQRVASLLAELTKVEAQRINLEARIQVLEEGKGQGVPEERLNKRNERINADPTVQELVRSIVRLEEDLIAARQFMTPENPLLKQKEEFVESFKKRLEEKRQEEANDIGKNELQNSSAQLEETAAYEKLLREKLAAEDDQTIQIGRKQLSIQDMQYQLGLEKEMYDVVTKRIQELEMERKRPARVSVAYNADIANIRDKRIKYSVAVVFAAIACGIGLALLKDKMDPSLRSPEDITRLLGVRIIGTTTNQETVEKALLPRQLTEDYQTIRANLGLLDSGGMPKKLVVTSAGMRDGKTTFSVNLATSLSRSGRKVLLIDGDLRKPDIGRLLNVPRDMRRLLGVLMGSPADDSAIAIVSPGLHVLASDSQNTVDPYELLVLPSTVSLIDNLSERYDHVIIDTPPVLAFPDALILAKIAGAVILASFAGRTSGPDLKETKDRLAQINVRILGTVMGNVHLGHTYYRYGYHYYAQGGRPERNSRRNGINPMLLSDKPQDGSDKPTS